jgi:hypothetical protein
MTKDYPDHSEICTLCKGSGDCISCDGTGQKDGTVGEVACDLCNGSAVCHECNGSGLVVDD